MMNNVKTVVHSYVSTKLHCDVPNRKGSETGPVTWSVLGQNIFLNTLLPSNTFICCFQIHYRG